MKFLLIIPFTVLYVQCSFGQLQFDIKSFNEKFEVVQWLCRYDRVAWETSDKVQASPNSEKTKLGEEWFCFEENHVWHAAYGKYSDGNYQLIFHYTVDTNWQVNRIYTSIDSFLLNSYARALMNANSQIEKLKDTSNTSFNHYIKRNEDSTLSVWILPAFSQDRSAIYGGEFYYKLDATGNHLLNKNEYFQGKFRGFKTDSPREIWLDYHDSAAPTVGSIFFVWYYKDFFRKIFIENKNSKSTVSYNKDRNEYHWVHYDSHN